MNRPEATQVLDVAIVGAGFGGLCAAIRLRESGIDKLCIFERGHEVGGTWRDNDYPGAACDVPSHMYSLSFASRVDWSRPYAQQAEIQRYLLDVTERYALRPLIRFGSVVQSMRWDAIEQAWAVHVEGRAPVLARHVVVATGPLNKPDIPSIPGVDRFAGPMFHSSQWRHDIDLRGKRVAVVGTGASAIQFVPEIAGQVADLTVFQRTPAWVVPRWDKPFGALRRWMFRSVPGLQRLERWRIYWFNETVGLGFLGSQRVQAAVRRLSLAHMRKQIPSESLRAALTPDFAPGCKRLLISNSWFPALQQSHVHLVTHAVAAMESDAVIAADGSRHPCDVVIWGTGFKATEFVAPMQVWGEASTDGSPRELGQQWRDEPARTHLGITVAGFPNFFMLVGPNTGLGHNSIVFMIECQVNYIVGALQQARRGVLRLKPDAQVADYAEVQRKMLRTVWASGCRSWYQNSSGQIDTLWPGFTWQYWLKTRRFDPQRYQ